MNVSSEQAAEEAVARLLRATRANDAEAAPARHSRQTDQCPSVARFAAVFRCGGRWAPAESAHVMSCGFCLDVMRMFQTAAAAGAQEDTVVNLGSDETHIGLPAPETKKRGTAPKPNRP